MNRILNIEITPLQNVQSYECIIDGFYGGSGHTPSEAFLNSVKGMAEDIDAGYHNGQIFDNIFSRIAEGAIQ